MNYFAFLSTLFFYLSTNFVFFSPSSSSSCSASSFSSSFPPIVRLYFLPPHFFLLLFLFLSTLLLLLFSLLFYVFFLLLFVPYPPSNFSSPNPIIYSSYLNLITQSLSTLSSIFHFQSFHSSLSIFLVLYPFPLPLYGLYQFPNVSSKNSVFGIAFREDCYVTRLCTGLM